VARLSLYPPTTKTGAARYALIANTIKNGVPSGAILLDGSLLGVDPRPTTEELLEAFDAAIRQHMLPR
jgi:hypothetical protein